MVTGLRQRRKADDMTEGGMAQPLLEHGDENHEERQPLLPNQQRQIIVHPGPFQLQSFLSSIFWCWQHLLGAVYSCLSSVLPLPSGGSTELTAMQEHQLRQLRARAAQPFQPEAEDDQQALRRLWAAAFPDIPCTSLKSPQWKEMGWQGEDPGTDFRGSGRLGLDCLLYLADHHAPTFSRLMLKEDGQRSEWEYPFAVAGLNITFKLMEVIGLQPSGQPSAAGLQQVLKCAAGQGFVQLLAQEGEGERAFEELFVLAFELLDREWLRQQASYMQFNQVLGAMNQRLEAGLGAKPRSVAELRAKVLPAR